MLERTDDDLGDEHRLGDHQSGTDDTQPDDRHEEDPGGAGIPQQAWIDWFHVKQALRSMRVCFT
ncbi:hypothetical protein EASAB2608_03461 [Streptomyces sp. EAS-AB2608]|nr:hypothetical protein [Streptomyces tricolor]BCM68127.1 hypothetical protein EASAB2608_03461 [Streptomyces sp. EAS-AB2608]